MMLAIVDCGCVMLTNVVVGWLCNVEVNITCSCVIDIKTDCTSISGLSNITKQEETNGGQVILYRIWSEIVNQSSQEFGTKNSWPLGCNEKRKHYFFYYARVDLGGTIYNN